MTRRPLRDLLAPPDSAAVERTWRKIADRRAGSSSSSPSPSARRRLAIAASIGLAAVAAITTFTLWPRTTHNNDAGPLSIIATGAEQTASLAAPIATDLQPRTIDLSDGSRVELSPHSNLAVRTNTGSHLHLALDRGRTTIHVQPGGPRRWTIDCGPATVEVTGTRFSIDRSPSRIEVAVTDGHVRVTSAELPTNVVELTAGQHITIPIRVITAASDQPAVTPTGRSGQPDTGQAGPPDTGRAGPPGQPGQPNTRPAGQPDSSVRTPDAGQSDSSVRTSDAGRDGRGGHPETGRPGQPDTGHAGQPDSSVRKPDAGRGGRAGQPDTGRAGQPDTGRTGQPDTSVRAADSTGRSGPPDTSVRATDAGRGESTWREHVARRDYRAAYAVLGERGMGEETAKAGTIEELVTLADVARLSGHARAAVGPLRRAAAMDGVAAAVAGYSLGRLLLDELREFGEAASAIEGAIGKGLPGGLDEPALARLVEAHAKAKHAADAKRWAEVYERKYPRGRDVEAVRRWGGAR